ncbi:AMAL-like protein [Mya arenaria]|uniref:AMAL-like protein n=1 Tax=Mya arenaria TaxID=6604 RepID=A0ABY7E837_MYAAR|nr:AMAL-like protein [Mya arenaria]
MIKIGSVFLLLYCYTAWGADPKVRLRQTFPETQLVYNYKTLVVEKDKDCYMACVVDNKPADKKVQWLIQNFMSNTTISISTDTDTQNAFKYQIDKPAANNWRLKIQNVQESDQALYICRVQLGGQQNANDSRMIQVIQKPQVVDIFTSSDTTQKEGDPLTLRCSASGIPTPMITWQMSGGGVLPTGGRELTSPVIVIPSVDRSYRGEYKCIAKNTAGVDVRRIYLVAPEVSVHQFRKEVYQAPGYSKELTCEAKGNPVPTQEQIIWYKEDQLLSDPNKYVMKSYFGSNYVLMKLRINDISDADYGMYTCHAENNEGGNENTVILSRSSSYVPEYEMFRASSGGMGVIALSVSTLLMFVATALLHLC